MAVKVSSVLGNGQKLDGGSMFGNAPRAVWEKWISPDELGRIPLSCRAMLVQVDDKNILCETGIGAFFEPKLADRFGVQNKDQHVLLKSLSQLGLTHEDIDFVILSHLHFDHAGGLLPEYSVLKSKDSDYELLFPNAKYVVGEEAYQRACNPHFRDRASFIPGLVEKLKSSERLVVVKNRAEKSTVLPDAIEFIYSDGHTPGQMLTKVNGKSASVVFTGDLVPGTPWVHLPITMGYDRFAEKVIDEKQSLYENIDLKNTYLFYTHDSDVAASKVIVSDRGKYQASEAQKDLQFLEL